VRPSITRGAACPAKGSNGVGTTKMLNCSPLAPQTVAVIPSTRCTMTSVSVWLLNT
jgi:hypothetical protein